MIWSFENIPSLLPAQRRLSEKCSLLLPSLLPNIRISFHLSLFFPATRSTLSRRLSVVRMIPSPSLCYRSCPEETISDQSSWLGLAQELELILKGDVLNKSSQHFVESLLKISPCAPVQVRLEAIPADNGLGLWFKCKYYYSLAKLWKCTFFCNHC